MQGQEECAVIHVSMPRKGCQVKGRGIQVPGALVRDLITQTYVL